MNPLNEIQGWGQPINTPTQNMTIQSSSESPHLDDLPHNQLAQPANLKAASIAISTNANISVELIGLPITHILDSPASGFSKQIDPEHPFSKTTTGK